MQGEKSFEKNCFCSNNLHWIPPRANSVLCPLRAPNLNLFSLRLSPFQQTKKQKKTYPMSTTQTYITFYFFLLYILLLLLLLLSIPWNNIHSPSGAMAIEIKIVLCCVYFICSIIHKYKYRFFTFFLSNKSHPFLHSFFFFFCKQHNS